MDHCIENGHSAESGWVNQQVSHPTARAHCLFSNHEILSASFRIQVDETCSHHRDIFERRKLIRETQLQKSRFQSAQRDLVVNFGGLEVSSSTGTALVATLPSWLRQIGHLLVVNSE